jgi:hypothetical protein
VSPGQVKTFLSREKKVIGLGQRHMEKREGGTHRQSGWEENVSVMEGNKVLVQRCR